MRSPIPVSYTHLDVYKRQAEMSVPACPIPIHHTKFTMAKPQPMGMVSVSYTHLDVYKRQDIAHQHKQDRDPDQPSNVALEGTREQHRERNGEVKQHQNLSLIHI